MDDIFEKLPASPGFNNFNVRPYEDGKIIKRISKSIETQNIYKERHPLNEFDFALQIIKKQQSNMQNAENVITLYQAIQTDKYYYISMERCENSIHQEFRKYNCRIQKGNQQLIIDFLYQIFKGYRFLQSINENFIHRDLTLENVLFKMVDGRIIVKIADFGISKTDLMIRTSNINQNFFFLAPEFIEYSLKRKNQEKYSNKVDIYSLGICLYTIMFGDNPQFVKDRGTLDITNNNQNKLVNLIIDMTNQNSENRLTWDQLQNRILEDHVIFHSEQYYALQKFHFEQYDKDAFLKYAILLINHYKTFQDGAQVYKPWIKDSLIHLELKRIDDFIQMINQANENEAYLLIQNLQFESQRILENLLKEIYKSNFQNLELLQINYYLKVISEKAKNPGFTQQSNHIIQEIRAKRDNQNYQISEQQEDVSERTCCLIM